MSYFYKLLCQNSETSQQFDITDLASDIQMSTSLLNQPGRLTFSLQSDPDGNKPLSNGSIIQLFVDGKGIFKGYIFRIGANEKKVWTVTAYDQLRYLLNKDTIYTENMSANQIFSRLCRDLQLSHRIDTPSRFIIPPVLHQKKTYYLIIEDSI